MNKTSVEKLARLTALGKRLEKDRKYMAWVLSSYQRQERLSHTKLAEKLSVSHESLIKLALCACPESASSNFREQVMQISAYCNVDSSIIVSIIRHVEALDALSSRSASDLSDNPLIGHLGVFSAARDNEEAGDNLKDKDRKDSNTDKDAAE